MKLRYIIISVLILIPALWGIGLWNFTSTVMSITPQDNYTKTDAIVVLTGGTQRVEEGLRLFALGRSGTLFITGVHPSVKQEEITAQWSGSPNLPECCIVLGYRATSTIQNAQELKEWLEYKEGIKSIRLVTANYHMPRAYNEFSHTLPDINILPHPIANHGFAANSWQFWNVMMSEYHKTMFRQLTMALSLDSEERLGG